MARSRRSRANRALTIFFLIALVLGAFYQIHRTKKASAVAKTVSPPAAPVTETPPIPAFAVTMMEPTTRPADKLTPNIWTPAPVVAAPPPAPARTTTIALSTPPPAPSPAVVVTADPRPLTDAQAKLDAGDLIGARETYNNAITSNRLSPAEVDSAKKHISQINQTLLFSTKRFAADPLGGVYTVKPGERLSAIASAHDVTWELLLRLNNMTDPRKLRAGQALKIVNGPFHVVVTKSKFTMDVYLGSPGERGSMYITSYPVGLGRDDSTPTGTWMVEPHHKIKHPTYYSPRGEGVIAADDPKNPLGPFWIGLTGTDGQAVGKASYGIHGTIEPDSIGKMASLGCIRMHNDDVALVFELLVEGKSTVIVKD
jgi:lipoprotein-anchoring transpeptidase ErfK/SrfK